MPSLRLAPSTRLSLIVVAGVAALALPAVAQERPSLDFLDVPARPRPSQGPVSPSEERGLDELESELGRFGASATAYRTALDQLALRRLRAQRRELDARFGRAIRDERALEAEARARTMQELERFLARHPTPNNHRADALLRLAELSVLASLDALDRGEVERPDFARAIELARQLLRESPGYPRLDQAAYLLGYALTESERPDEALAVWRGLVCASRFGFDPAPAVDGAEPAHPALSGARGPRDLGADPYAGCAPALDTPLSSEIWLRIGEHHFDGDHGELAAAMSAYGRVARDERDPLYGFGLYKLAWSHYRASQFAEAVERFGQLVAWSDARERATGRAGSDLRTEAVQYIAIALAYEDWNEDGAPDRAQGGPSTLERMSDAALVPPEARWAHDVRRATGDALFEEARYPEAIAAWREALARQPGACDTADVALSIARAHRRLGQSDEALAVLGAIAEQGNGDRFAVCTVAQRDRALRLSEQALAASGAFHHRLAQGLRAQERMDEASREYAMAVRAYRMHIERFPHAPRSYQLGFDMADALYWSGRHEEAADAYESVVRSRFDDRLMARAARRVVESRTRALEAEVASGALDLREHAPSLGAGGAITAEAVPPALQRVARAREIYVRWIERDDEGVRDAYAFNNASLLYRYGFWPEARERFLALYESGCSGPRASRIAGDALLALRDMAAAREDTSELARLAADVRSRACTFDPEGSPVRAEGCVVPGSLPCELEAMDGDVAFARLSREAAALASIADRDARRSRAETIARGFVAAVDRAPHHPHAPLALHRAAHLLSDEAGRPADAERVYQRIVDELTPRATELAADRAQLDRVVADAHFELARIAHRTFDVERALAAYSALVEADRFARSADPEVQRVRRDALVNAALLASDAGYHARAAEAWARAAHELSGVEAREARLRAAEERLRASDAGSAARELDRWLREEAATDALTVRAWSARADAAARMNDRGTRERALARTVETYRGLAAGDASSAILAARSALTLADLSARAFTPARIRVASRPTVRESIEELARAVRSEASRLRPLIEAYDQAIAIGHAPVTAGALARQGELYEALVRGVLGAEVELPRELTRALRGASAGAQRDARAQFADAIRAQLDELVRPVECRAVERYVLATRLSRRLGVASADVDHSHARLAAYGEERVADCLRAATERDPTFAPYAPGELDRARPGRVAPPRPGTAPPALER